MKKLLTVLFALLLLVGCSNAGYSKVSNGEEVLFKGPKTTFTKADLYNVLKISSEDAITKDIITTIAKNLKIDLTDIEAQADDSLKMYEEMGYEYYIIYYYGSLDAYKQQYIYSGIVTELSKIYVNDKFDTLVETDKPVKMKMAYFYEEEAAKKALDAINNGTSFEMACTNNGYDQQIAEAIYTDSDDMLAYEVKQYLTDTDKLGLSSIITASTSSQDADGNIVTNNTYYLLDVTDRDVNNFKDDYIATVLEDVKEEDVVAYMLEKHQIEFYDQDIYKLMSKAHEVLQ